jgi:hypothetical protein
MNAAVTQPYDDRMTKARITISVDERYVDAAKDAVRLGEADSVSAWVEAAMAERAENDKHLRGLRQLVAEYEDRHGAFTPEELEESERRAMKDAERVRLEGMRRRGELRR